MQMSSSLCYSCDSEVERTNSTNEDRLSMFSCKCFLDFSFDVATAFLRDSRFLLTSSMMGGGRGTLRSMEHFRSVLVTLSMAEMVAGQDY